MQRICFTLQIRPDRLADYKARHAQVWPAMRQALADTGWHDYTLFLRPDGLLIGYLVTEDFAQAQQAMAALEINAKWQAEMAPFFDGIAVNPDEAMRPIEEIFHLD